MDEEIIDKVKMLAMSAKSFLKFDKVIIFGSYAKGTNHIDSDIDVAFVVSKMIEDHLELSAKLFELVYKIDYRIEPIIISGTNDRSGFLESILKSGKEIHLN